MYRFLPYEIHPLKLKEKTDKCADLLSQVNRKLGDVDIDQLKPRELKVLEQVKVDILNNK